MFVVVLALGCGSTSRVLGPSSHYDVIIRGGTVYDGLGGAPVAADVAISGDRIAAIGRLGGATSTSEIDAHGLAVAPGFINMLSWANESLIADGRSQADIRQGVTLEVMGEGISMGPLNPALTQFMVEGQVDIKYDVTWTTLGGYLEFLEQRGVAPNVASFVGATSVRLYELGEVDRAPTPAELVRMRELVRQAMRDGALGLASALMYPPGFYAKTDELVELCKVVSEYGGVYITHMRSEGMRLLEAIDEVLTIAREANVPVEIYHLKASARENWPKMEQAIATIEAARRQGVRITADMYTYPAAQSPLSAAMPPWSQEGGHDAFVARMKDPATRARIARDMTTPSTAWDNWFLGAGPEGIYPQGFGPDALRPLAGKSLAEIATLRGQAPEQVAMDLLIENGTDILSIYFLMSEDNIRTQLRLPWISLASDAESPSTEGVFLKSPTHPRAYGNFARWLGKYVRDEKLVPLADAIRRMTSLPATNLGIQERGVLRPHFFADVVVFDPATIQDHATFDRPHQYSTGVKHVFVNGTQVLREGEHTGETPGRVVRGPGYQR